MIQLVIEAGVGIAVLVRCFVNKKSMETEIIDRLGNGFSRAPFATVVVFLVSIRCLSLKLAIDFCISSSKNIMVMPNICRLSVLLFPSLPVYL